MDFIVTRNTFNLNDTVDTDELFLKSLKPKRKFFFVYDGIKFVSDKEIIGVEPKTYKLIYKKDN